MTASSLPRTVTLRDGALMPTVGFGVYMITDGGVCERSVESAVGLGYRLIDTAVVYGNERPVGRGIAASGVPREDLFVTTKLWLTHYSYERAKASIDDSLARLGLEYVDLMLLHQPYPEYLGGWKALEEAVDAGKIRSLGVSNFEVSDLERLHATARIMPVVNQIEMHPYYQRPDLVAFMREHDIVVESWAPLGHGSKGLLAEPLLAELAAAHGKSVPQVLLRWHLQRGFVIIPKSTNPRHIAANLDLFDFELSAAEMARFAELDTGRPNRAVPRWVQRTLFPHLPVRQLP